MVSAWREERVPTPLAGSGDRRDVTHERVPSGAVHVMPERAGQSFAFSGMTGHGIAEPASLRDDMAELRIARRTGFLGALVLVALSLVAGCAEPAGEHAPNERAAVPRSAPDGRPTPSLDSLLAAPLAVTIGGREATLAPELARDFQPPSPGGPVVTHVVVRLSGTDLFPEDVNIARLWLVHEERVLPLGYKVRGRAVPGFPPSLTILAIDGPFWPVGDSVVVVVEIVDADGATHLLRAPTKTILEVS